MKPMRMLTQYSESICGFLFCFQEVSDSVIDWSQIDPLQQPTEVFLSKNISHVITSNKNVLNTLLIFFFC